MIFHFPDLLSTTGNLANNSELYNPNLFLCPGILGKYIYWFCLDQRPIWVEYEKEHFLREGREGVYFPEERVRDENSRYL